MTTSIITKKKIAKSFKVLFVREPFEKISVSKIMTDAQMRRQTFYDHFVDKYDLLGWIFQTELQEQITDNLSYISGLALLKELCFFFQQNRLFYHKLFGIVDQNDFSSYFFDYSFQLVLKILEETASAEELALDGDRLVALTTYHTHAITQMIKVSLQESSQDINDLYPVFKEMLVLTARVDRQSVPRRFP